MFAGVVGLVHHEEVGDLQDARLVHLDRVAHARHDDDRGPVDVFSDGDVVLARADGLDEQGVPSGAAHQFDDVGKGGVVLAHDGEAAIEDVVVHRVEVDAKAITEQGAAGDGTHGVEGDHRHAFPATDRFVRHRGDQRALARAGSAGQADDPLGPRSRGICGWRAGVGQAQDAGEPGG